MIQLQSVDEPISYAVEFPNGQRRLSGPGAASFTISAADERSLERILRADDYTAAMAFVRGEIEISGDIVAALRLKRERAHPGPLNWFWAAAARFAPIRLETLFQSRERAARNIRFHYDRSNEFYSTFLDSRMVYSSALFKDPDWTLEQAQSARLDSICRKLDLRTDEEFLDIGCGWGALVMHAVERDHVHALGCTLSRGQYEYATAAIARRGLDDCAQVQLVDYRRLSGRFKRISSIGMFEHVGRHRLRNYFKTVYGLLEDDGVFFNSGITRPQPVSDDPETQFLQTEVFPGGELAHLSDILRDAENAGFQVLDLKSLRLDYARTCREWVRRLQSNATSCIDLVGEKIYRTWLLYLAASVVSFEDGLSDVHELLFAKRGVSEHR